MSTLKEEKNKYQEENERIKVFLKIKPSLSTDKILFNISSDRRTISLLDNISLDDSKKTKKIEMDKIFTKNDVNSYIYEEIMRNCVKNSLDGENFTFISYGDSNSEKHNLIIGTPDCYENINNRGLLPRFLESYINKIESDEILSDNISINISYMLINNNNLIDLSQLMGREKKTLEKITRDELIKKYSKEIKVDEKNKNILKSIIKTPIEKANDSLFFLLQILNLFYKLEANNSHFLTWSYFIIIIYVTDNNGKSISTINFIIMPGNELLLHKLPKTKSFYGGNRKDNIGNALRNNANELSYTIEDILEYLDVKHLNENKDNNNENKKNLNKEIKSKLFNLIGTLAFDVNNKKTHYKRKYIVIGSIFGNSGFISNTKDTLYFLFQCQKFSQQKLVNKNKEEFFDSSFCEEKLRIKDLQIYDLESKLKTQEAKLEELNNLMDSKDENIKALQANYKKQIDLLKEELEFSGDINNLLTGNKKTYEYMYSLKIRSTTDNNKLKNLKIEELKKQITQIETVIKQLKTLLDVKRNDSTMLEILRTVREAKEKKKKDVEIRNALALQIEDMANKNKILENKILGFKNEINVKKKLLSSLPNIFNENMDAKNDLNTFENRINDINNDYEIKFIGNNNEDGIKKLKTDENNEKNIIIDKYENIMEQNKKEIIKIGNKYDNLNVNFKIKRNGYLDELVRLYKFIINIIKLYQKIFVSNCSVFMKKEKFNKLLEKEEKEINCIVYPFLYDELGKIGFGHFQLNNKRIKSKIKIIKSKYYKDIKEEEDSNYKYEENEKRDFLDKNKRNERIQKIIEKIKNGSEGDDEKTNKNIPLVTEIIDQRKKAFHGIEKKTEIQLVSMSREMLQQYSKNFTEKISSIEDYINHYIEIFDNNIEFNPVQEKINEIKTKLKVLNNKISQMSYKYQNNNIAFENGDKVIQRLKNENYLLKKQIYDIDKKNIFSTITPSITNNHNHLNIFKKRNNSNKNNLKLKLFNSNNYNTIMTTASSNNGLLGPIGITEQNYTLSKIKERSTLDINDQYSYTNRGDFFKNRPISSYNTINPYYIVAENLK